MVLRIIVSVLIGGVAFVLAGPIQYSLRTEPQRAAFAQMARESQDEIKKVASSEPFDYRASMKRIRDREARARQLVAEQSRIRKQTWAMAVVSLLVAGGGTFVGLSLLSKRRRIVAATTAPPVQSQ